jgi:hypothetical protein
MYTFAGQARCSRPASAWKVCGAISLSFRNVLERVGEAFFMLPLVSVTVLCRHLYVCDLALYAIFQPLALVEIFIASTD